MESQAVEQLTTDIENPSTESVNTPVVGVTGDTIKKKNKEILGNNSLELQNNIGTNNTELNVLVQEEEVQNFSPATLPQDKNLKGCWEDEDGNRICSKP